MKKLLKILAVAAVAVSPVAAHAQVGFNPNDNAIALNYLAGENCGSVREPENANMMMGLIQGKLIAQIILTETRIVKGPYTYKEHPRLMVKECAKHPYENLAVVTSRVETQFG